MSLLKSDPRPTTQKELRYACRAQTRSLQELLGFYLPFLDGLTMIVQGKAPFERERITPFRDQLEPALGRACYALRLADELVLCNQEPLLPPEDPRVPSAMIRAMLESILAVFGALTDGDLKATPLVSRRQLQDMLEEPLLALWLDRNDLR